MSGTGRTPIVLLGMMTNMPVAGVVWQTLHYLLGFERLGYEAHYVEMHGRTPTMLMTGEADDGAARAASLIAAVMRRFDLGDRWAYRALYDRNRCFGTTDRELTRRLSSAGMIVNLHGGTEPLPELTGTDRLVYLETDPVQLQLELAGGYAPATAFLEPHCAFFTFAENYGRPDCGLPVSDRFEFRTTRQPVLPELWKTTPTPSHDRFTTIGNWRQNWRDVAIGGELYTWSKHHEFERFLDLPARAGARFELAISSYRDEDRTMLERRGWRVTPSLGFSMDLLAYRRFIADSAGEFTVAKDQNVRLRTGWFSDRSATYLASGRPVITQDTGFGCALPTGDGLFAFSSSDAVVEAIERIDREPERHGRAARAIATEYFAPEVVLGDMLRHMGMGVPGRGGEVPRGPYPFGMVLTPASRRPTRLTSETVEAVLSTPPVAPAGAVAAARPDASLVVVSFDSLLFTRMCVETVLSATREPRFELIVVDNGSADGSRDYLVDVAARDPRVRVLANDANAGFPAACNQGIEAARGKCLVLLNSDTVVAPGWLARLLAHLDAQDVGMAGPVTNRIGNEAEVAVDYHTYGGFLRAARARAAARHGASFEIPTLTMFCLAMRREVQEALGPLDTSFGVGTLEDDDYSHRARRAGYRLVCAEDVLVHHFGEASFGKLFADGEYSRVIERNRRRFEAKWGQPWQPYRRRDDPAYASLVQQLRKLVTDTLPVDCTVLVVSRGDDQLVELDGVRARHFPGLPDGGWAGHHPADSAEAIAGLRELRAQGADYIVFPGTSLWWLDFYDGLARYLCDGEVLRDESCAIFALAREDASG